MSIHTQNIAVLGAGIMGLMSAFRLQKSGHKVRIYDPNGFPADNASFKAGGMLAPYAEIEHMPRAFLEPCFESIRLWEELARGHDFEFARQGSLLVAHKQDRHMLERFGAHLEEARFVGSSDIEGLEPALSGRFTEGLFLAEEGQIHPRKVMAFLADSLEGKVEEAADPAALAGQYDAVIDCRGMGAQAVDKDLRGVKGELIIVHNPELFLNRPVRLMHPRYSLYTVPRAGNIFMIGATNIETEDESGPALKSAMELMSALVTLHPSFAESRIMEVTAGVRPSYADNLPRIRQEGNIISCNGLYRHGFLLSPIMAECTAALVEGRENAYISYFTDLARKAA
ncbi:MAG: FAD-dependent oxidoreductase [Alphaproteobacteria bacterium]|nr:FAD-dependent oxidoreductase [Alphaproteobacteria bacterium]